MSYAPISMELEGKVILWVDDRPDNNAAERARFEGLGATVLLALTNDEALEAAAASPPDLMIADIERGVDEEGSELGIRLWASGHGVPVIHYVTLVDPDQPPPVGAVGITADPDELHQMVLDTLASGG